VSTPYDLLSQPKQDHAWVPNVPSHSRTKLAAHA